ncbi:MAG: glycosyltransferase family 4 protein [Acidimicrobiales bacterium]|nr:glycosyltransferase family 4 protein [Acidimicrobiales bacterium]
MKITVVAPQPVPPNWGGAERATEGLVHHLAEHAGHEAELVRLPVPESTLHEVIDGYRRFSRLDLSGSDAVISCKYPAWITPHEHHRLLMFHPLRGLYDTYRTFRLPYTVDTGERAVRRLVELAEGEPDRDRLDELFGAYDDAVAQLGADHPCFSLPGPLARTLVHHLDLVALVPDSIERHLTLSSTVAARPGYLPHGVMPLVAHLPSDLPTVERHDPVHLVTASRLDGPKRLDLLIAAFRRTDVEVPLVIAGTGPQETALRDMAEGDERIRFAGFVSDDELAELYGRAIAVPFVPLDEDLGLITLEAMAAGAPVITCTDSGGPTELVADGATGWVVPPTVDALAAAIEEAVADPERTTDLGARGRRRGRLVSWDRVARRLLDGLEEPAPPATAPPVAPSTTAAPGGTRPKVVVATTFALEPALGGGQIRARNLYQALNEFADVEVVCLAPADARSGSRELAPGFVETVVPRSWEHQRRENTSSQDLGVPTGDVMIGELIEWTPAYPEALARAAAGADALVLAEPYQLPSVRAAGIDLPIVYDAYNVEAGLKRSVFPPTAKGRELLAAVEDVEAAAMRAATLVVACSPQDATELAERYPDGTERKVLVVGNGVDPDQTPFTAPAARRRVNRAWLDRFAAFADANRPHTDTMGVFIGSHHPPNLDAVDLLCDVAAERPHLVVLLCGSHTLALYGRRLPPNVVSMGVVTAPVKAALLRAADVAFNPMRIGSGTNLKILEYLAAGAPVLSTPFGARGLEVVDGEHLVLAEPGDWPSALDRMMADTDGLEHRARAGRALIEQRYSWSALGRSFADAVAPLVGVEGRSPT